MQLPGFVGGSNVLSSTLEDCELTVNEFPEIKTGGFTKNEQGWLPRRPGMTYLFSVGSDPVECLFYIDGRAFGVAGAVFFEYFNDNTFIVRGTVATGQYAATMCSNGHAGNQILVISGFKGYIFSLPLNTLTLIADPDFQQFPVMCEFFGGYFLVLGISSAFTWSALEDGTSWDPLDVAFRSWAADDIVFIRRNGTHIWLIGQQTSEVWYATGDVAVFGPAQESLIEHGSIARFTGVRTPQGIACLDQDERGVGQVILFAGLTPESISTYAINLEQQIQAGVLDQAVAFVVQMRGHVFLIVNNAAGTFRLTPVYDFSEGLWHHWAHWDATNCKWIPFRGQCATSAFQRVFVGDRLSGAVCELDFDALVDTLPAVA